MPLNIIRNDITRVEADAIVNTANPLAMVGAGTDRAIYDAAGREALLAERTRIGEITPGQAVYTKAFALKAKYIIHTVGPEWLGGGHHERETVASCYRNSLDLADELGCETVAFPLISTGTYGFPKDEALRIAVDEISSFLFSHDMTVFLVVYDKESFVISGKAFADIKSYIEDHEVRTVSRSVTVSVTVTASGLDTSALAITSIISFITHPDSYSRPAIFSSLATVSVGLAPFLIHSCALSVSIFTTLGSWVGS